MMNSHEYSDYKGSLKDIEDSLRPIVFLRSKKDELIKTSIYEEVIQALESDLKTLKIDVRKRTPIETNVTDVWRLMGELEKEGRQPPVIVLENVVGTISANQETDFRSLMEALVLAGCRVGPMIIDVKLFVPQSRPRLFNVAVNQSRPLPLELIQNEPSDQFCAFYSNPV